MMPCIDAIILTPAMRRLQRAVLIGLFLWLTSSFARAEDPPGKQPQNQRTTNPAPGPTSQQVEASAPNELFVNVGKSLIVDSAIPIERVSVGFGDIAEATAVGPTEVLVNGKAPGETSLIIWQQGNQKLFFDVTVQPSRYATNSRLDQVRRELNQALPGQKIDVTIDNDQVYLRGTVKDLTSADRAVAIASSVGKPVNLLYVDVPSPEPQILLKVRFASVDRSLTDSVGFNLFSLGAANTIGSTTTGQFGSTPGINLTNIPGNPPKVPGSPTRGFVTQSYSISNALNILLYRPDLNLGAVIEALQARNLLQVLAEPNVLATNGKQASFLAGGQFPYPVVQGSSVGGTNAVTIQFQQFGVRLNFIPTITPRGTIRLQVAPEVSALDYANGVTISGFTVPGISVRNVNTEVELAEGQSFALAGLLDNRETETFDKIPWIGDVPILGQFFKSRTKTKNNTELMVIVTPELVRPTPAGKEIAAPNYPAPFLPPNSNTPMRTPGLNVTGPVPVTPPTASVPVETLIKSFQERPLSITSTTPGVVYGPGGAASPTASPAATPQTTPP
jgi:pilus assembly protein CpaC